MHRFVVLLALLAASASAQTPPRAADLVAWTVATATAPRGGTSRVVLRATIAPGWRLYAMDSRVGRPLALAVDRLPDGVLAGTAQQSRPRQGFDEAFEQAYTYFADEAEVVVPVRVSRGAAPGRHAVVGAVRYAICDDTICLPPATTPFRTTLTVR